MHQLWSTGYKYKEWFLCLALFILAFLIRLPYLFEVPRFIDEWREIELSAEIARGDSWPLHNTSHDIGPFHNYVLAFLFKLFGFHLHIPRLYVTTLSAATVVGTYWLARYFTGVRAALFAALLLATNSMHILVTHMAWSNDTTPFFVVISLLITMKALDERKSILWGLTGFSWAIALQTHPSVLAALIGVGIHLASQDGWKSFYQEKNYRTAGLCFILGYSNMIIHNIKDPLDSILWIKRKDYALNDELSLPVYLNNIKEMAKEWIFSLASAFPGQDGLLHDMSKGLIFLFIAGLFYGLYHLISMRHGMLLVAVLGVSFLIIPLFNERYVFYVSTRYIGYMIPIGCLAVSLGFSTGILGFANKIRTAWTPFMVGGMGTIAMIMVTLPLFHFYAYAQSYVESGQDNSAEFSAVENLLMADGSLDIAIDKQAKQAEAVSKMLRVKGAANSLVGVDPSEVKEVHAASLNDQLGKIRWAKILEQERGQTRYVLSLETKEFLSAYFHVKWSSGEMVKSRNGEDVFFIGTIESYDLGSIEGLN